MYQFLERFCFIQQCAPILRLVAGLNYEHHVVRKQKHQTFAVSNQDLPLQLPQVITLPKIPTHRDRRFVQK